jgi:hypothetical protein
MQQPDQTNGKTPLPRWLAMLLGLAALVYLALIAARIAPYAGGSDSGGYLGSARLFAEGRLTTEPRSLPGHDRMEFGQGAFQPLGYAVLPGGDRMVPTYPPGLPLHLALFRTILGEERAVVSTNLFAIVLLGWAMWTGGRALHLSAAWTASAIAFLAGSPIFVFSALQPMSDLLAAAWTMAALAAALRARTSPAWGWAAGAAIGMAVLIRPTNALVLLPAFISMGPGRAALQAAAAGLPFALFLGYYNHAIYGHPLASGYGNWRESFSAANAALNALPVARGFVVLLSPFVLGLLLVPFAPTMRSRPSLVLGLWVATLAVCYLFYFHTGEAWWYFRFLLPIAPAALLLAASGWSASFRRLFNGRPGRWSTALALAGLTACLAWQAAGLRRYQPAEIVAGERYYREAADWARRHLPADAAVFCMQDSSALHYYADFIIVRWDHMSPGQHAALVRAARAQKRPVYAALFPFEEQDALSRIGGRWEKLATIGPTTIYRLAEIPP